MNLLDTRQASKELNVSIHTLRSWIYQKKLPYVKLGRRCLFKQEELEAFVDKNVVGGKARLESVGPKSKKKN